eukprot:765386-Hanusia_phi.AAC.3
MKREPFRGLQVNEEGRGGKGRLIDNGQPCLPDLSILCFLTCLGEFSPSDHRFQASDGEKRRQGMGQRERDLCRVENWRREEMS